MAKYLRYIAFDFRNADGIRWAQPAEFNSAVSKVSHLGWMYEHYATPLPSGGVAKVNVAFTTTELNDELYEVLGIAEVYERFDAAHFLSLSPKKRQLYFLDRLHAALLRCAKQFGWDPSRLDATYQRILAEEFAFRFFWKKPLSSPNRQMKVQALIEVKSFPAHLYLIFFDRDMHEMGRTLLSVGTDGPGAVEFALGEIRWLDANTVRVQHQNGRDYWLCTTQGELEFHYRRAENGDRHGQYDLGRMYYDGQWVLKDQEMGLQWIQAAADQGYRHAIQFLANLKNVDGNHDSRPA